MRKAYIQVKDGSQYYDYDAVYMDATYAGSKLYYFTTRIHDDSKIYVDSDTFTKLNGNINITPTKNSKVYLGEKNPYAVADIRKNYTIVRNMDKADYVLYSFENLSHDIYWRNCIIFPKAKVVAYYRIYYDSTNWKKIHDCAVDALKGYYNEDLLDDHSFFHSQTYQICEQFKPILEILLGISQKNYKLANYKSLDMSTGEEVTLDSLKILSGALLNKYWSSRDEVDASTVLMTFHNFDYRSIPGTMSRVFDILMDNSRLLNDMSSHNSKFSKPVRDLLQTYAQRWGRKYQEFASQEDFNLCYQFIESLVNVGNSIVVNHDTYDRKLNNCPVSEELLNEMYNVVVRVTPKKYEDFIPAKQDGNTACEVQV